LDGLCSFSGTAQLDRGASAVTKSDRYTEHDQKRNHAMTVDKRSAAPAPVDGASQIAHTGYARLMAFQKDNLDAVMQSQMILRDGAIAWSNSLLDFVGQHFQQHLNRPDWLINSADPVAAAAAQIRYVQTSTEDCLEQAAKFLNLVSKVSRDSRTHLETHVTTTLGHFGAR
jgi:hypothetical protein